jgi:hypothetical protein
LIQNQEMKKKSKSLFHLIALSLGEKAGKDDREADKVAVIRILMFLSVFITNSFIVFGVAKTHLIPRDYVQKVECVNLK